MVVLPAPKNGHETFAMWAVSLVLVSQFGQAMSSAEETQAAMAYLRVISMKIGEWPKAARAS